MRRQEEAAEQKSVASYQSVSMFAAKPAKPVSKVNAVDSERRGPAVQA